MSMYMFPGKDASGICWKFLEGKCIFGLKCKYNHPDNGYISPYQIMNPLMPSQSTPLQEPAVMYPFLDNTQWTVPHIPYIRVAPRREDQHARTPHMPPFYTFYQPLSWKTTPCKHFVKTKGWCPLGNACNYVHDLTLQAIPAEEKSLSASSIPPVPKITSELFYPDGDHDCHIGNKAQRSVSTSHCWAYVQGFCRTRGCRYFHPRDIQPYMKYTPCLAWSACPNIDVCAFKHPEPLHAVSASLTYPPNSHIPTSNDAGLVYLPQVVNGTTYFPIAVPTLQDFTTASFHDGDMSTLQPSIFDADSRDAQYLNPNSSQGFQPSLMTGAGGRVESEAVDTLPGPNSDYEHGSYTGEALSKTSIDETGRSTSTEDHEFPYRPPRNQRVGHARRFSVALKSRELGDEGSGSTETGHLRRMTHASRDKRKSWAAFSHADRFQTGILQR